MPLRLVGGRRWQLFREGGYNRNAGAQKLDHRMIVAEDPGQVGQQGRVQLGGFAVVSGLTAERCMAHACIQDRRMVEAEDPGQVGRRDRPGTGRWPRGSCRTAQ